MDKVGHAEVKQTSTRRLEKNDQGIDLGKRGG
jgi:hypothetical protein